jgi:hypothetical protein
MFCKQCGTKAEDGVKFCTSCGAALEIAVANNGPVMTQAEPAKVIIIRLKKFTGSIRTINVFIDGIEAARLKNGETVTIDVNAGKHQIYCGVLLSWQKSQAWEFTANGNVLTFETMIFPLGEPALTLVSDIIPIY